MLFLDRYTRTTRRRRNRAQRAGWTSNINNNADSCYTAVNSTVLFAFPIDTIGKNK